MLSSSEFIENIEIDEQLVNRLEDTLAEEREKIFGGIDRRDISAADTNIIELVGMMFEYMLKEENLPNIVKALLSRLHTPLLKVAVIDNRFFTESEHSARKLLNNMTAAGIRWVEEDRLDRGIFPKLKDIVDKVLLEFKENVEIFDALLEELAKAVGELDHRASLVEQRTNEAANGQEKLQAARSRVQKEIRILAQGTSVDDSAQEFLQRIWADKLTFILLRNSEADESEEWQSSLKLARRIVESSTPPTSEEQRSTRKAELSALQEELRTASSSLQQVDKEKLISALFAVQNQALDAEIIPPSEPQQSPEPEVAETEPDPAPQDEQKPLSPEQEAMLEKLKSIPFGTWFDFHKPGEPGFRAKLSWRSTITEKFMFVDAMGVKAAVISMHELADCILDGRVTIVSEEKKPFVDRALNAIHRMLDRAA